MASFTGSGSALHSRQASMDTSVDPALARAAQARLGANLLARSSITCATPPVAPPQGPSNPHDQAPAREPLAARLGESLQASRADGAESARNASVHTASTGDLISGDPQGLEAPDTAAHAPPGLTQHPSGGTGEAGKPPRPPEAPSASLAERTDTSQASASAPASLPPGSASAAAASPPKPVPPLAPRGSVEGFKVAKGPGPDPAGPAKDPSTSAPQPNGKGSKAADASDPLPAPGGSVRARATAWEQQQQQQQPAIRVPVWVPPQRAFSTTDAVLQWLNEERRARPSQLSSSSLTGAMPCMVQVIRFSSLRLQSGELSSEARVTVLHDRC